MRSGLVRSAFALALLLAVLHAAPCRGQELTRTVRMSEENDYFDFSRPWRQRPDDNYTQGLRVGWDVASVPSFMRPLLCPARHACASTFEIGQEMYTPTVDGVRPIPGQRPYAGWLSVSASTVAATHRTRRAVGITLGVTGPASLAEQTQAAFHHLIRRFHQPLGWAGQLPTEPGFAIDAEEAWHFGAPGRAARWLDIIPTMQATAGTLRIALSAGGRVRLGFPLSHPWLVDAGARPWEVYIFSGGQVEAVARDMFLDGTTFHPSVRVQRQPLVMNWERGIGTRLGRLGIEYRIVAQGREYRNGPVAHPFGGFTITWRATR